MKVFEHNKALYLIVAIGIIGNQFSKKDLDLMVVVQPIAPQLNLEDEIKTISTFKGGELEDWLEKLSKVSPELKEVLDVNKLPIDLTIVGHKKFEQNATKMDSKTWQLVCSEDKIYQHDNFKQACELIKSHYFNINRYYVATKGHIKSIMYSDTPKAYRMLDTLNKNLVQGKDLNGHTFITTSARTVAEYAEKVTTDEVEEYLNDVVGAYDHLSTKFIDVDEEIRLNVLKLLSPVIGGEVVLPLYKSSHCEYPPTYNLLTKTLVYRFRGGEEDFYYYNVPLSVLQDGLNAPSWGRWFNTNMKFNPVYQK